MRISDWSSDVCSSDLVGVIRRRAEASEQAGQEVEEGLETRFQAIKLAAVLHVARPAHQHRLFGPVVGEEALEFAISDGVAQLFIEDVGVEGGAAGIMFEGEVELVGEDRFQPGKARFGAEGEIIAADIASTVADDEIGRASWRARVCKAGESVVVSVARKQKK